MKTTCPKKNFKKKIIDNGERNENLKWKILLRNPRTLSDQKKIKFDWKKNEMWPHAHKTDELFRPPAKEHKMRKWPDPAYWWFEPTTNLRDGKEKID